MLLVRRSFNFLMFTPVFFFFFSVLGYNFFSFEIILIAKLTFLCPNKPYKVPICPRCGAPWSPGDRESDLQSCFLSPWVAFCFVLSPRVRSQGNRVSPSPGKNFLGIPSIHPPRPLPQEGFTNEQKQCRNPSLRFWAPREFRANLSVPVEKCLPRARPPRGALRQPGGHDPGLLMFSGHYP